MSKDELLAVIDDLYGVRDAVQGSVEPAITELLDEAIGQLEDACRDEELKDVAGRVLEILGVAVKLLPAIATLLEHIQKR